MCSSAHLLLLSCSAHFANLLWHYMGYFKEFKNRHFVMLLFLFWYFNPLFSGSGDKYFFALSHILGGRGVGGAWNKRILFILVMYSLCWLCTDSAGSVNIVLILSAVCSAATSPASWWLPSVPPAPQCHCHHHPSCHHSHSHRCHQHTCHHPHQRYRHRQEYLQAGFN